MSPMDLAAILTLVLIAMSAGLLLYFVVRAVIAFARLVVATFEELLR